MSYQPLGDPSAGHLVVGLETELANQRMTVAREVRRLQAIEDLLAFVARIESDHGSDYAIEDLDQLERLVGGDVILESRLEDLINRAKPTTYQIGDTHQ